MANSEQKHVEGEFHSWDTTAREGPSEIQFRARRRGQAMEREGAGADQAGRG